MDMFKLNGKNAVVVGGAGGLGQAIAQGLAEAGAKVAIASRREESLQRARQEIKEAIGAEISCYVADATDEASVEALVEKTVADMGRVDILVCAQGMNKKFPSEDFPLDVFRQMFDANVTSVMLCCKHFGRHMKENHYGKMILLSSVRGKIASRNAGNMGYCTTKGAVDMLTRQFAADFAADGITVNAIGPNVTETPMMKKIIEERGGDEYRKAFAKNLPLNRMPVPEDCVGPAVFLASPASDFVTGNILYPDGGLTCVG